MLALKRNLFIVFALALVAGSQASAIDIVLDYTLDDQNEGWFSGSPEGLARRASVDAAAGFLSAILTNDDWDAVSISNKDHTFTDIAASTLNDLNGNPVAGTPESDGQGYNYEFDVTNLSTVNANEYVIYVGAFEFDPGTSSHAKAGWDSSTRRNAAGFAGQEFNTWGGKMYFDTGDTWYTGQNPGTDPTDDYGTQDPDKTPSSDITTDNWDWHTTSLVWKGFDLTTIDPAASGRSDLYATALHELTHALGATTSNMSSYVGVVNNEFVGANVVAEYGGPVPKKSTSGHFDNDVQSEVWDSNGIISEVTLDPNSTNGRRKYLTKLDAALLRDLGYDVLSTLASPFSPADFNQDTLVDSADLAIWTTGYGLDATGDADGDGDTDGADLLFWQRELGLGQGNLSASLSVPEPSSLLLGVMAIAGLSMRSRALS